MQHYLSIDPIHIEGSWITIGSFDGVHLGHQKIITQLVENAHLVGNPAVVVTFHPHPAVVLGKTVNGGYLSSPQERADLLGNLGVDYVLTLPFTRELAALSALDFMTLLTRHLGIRHLLVGYDFALGRQREGNVDRLREIGAELGYDVSAFTPVESDGIPISSSQIRRLIRAGEMQPAANLLGRFYSVDGKVVHGDGRGKSMGFPTANLEYWDERVMPANGIYATRAWLDGICHSSVSNLGIRPTFENTPPLPLLEAYLMNFSGEIYGKTLRLEFVARLRPEIKFSSIEELMDQMNRDKVEAMEVLDHVR